MAGGPGVGLWCCTKHSKHQGQSEGKPNHSDACSEKRIGPFSWDPKGGPFKKVTIGMCVCVCVFFWKTFEKLVVYPHPISSKTESAVLQIHFKTCQKNSMGQRRNKQANLKGIPTDVSQLKLL